MDERERNYNNCPFKVSLPQIEVNSKETHLVFSIMGKRNSQCYIAFDGCLFVYSRLERFTKPVDTVLKSPRVLREQVHLCIMNEKNRLTGELRQIQLSFLAENGEKYDVTYEVKRAGSKISLWNITHSPMSKDETARLKKYICEANRTGPDPGPGPTSGPSPFQYPQIREYIESLNQEMNYLRKNGGRKHRINNGSFISRVNSFFAYGFELESELHLADDAPITLSIGNMEASGYVLVCEGFEIIVVLDTNMGTLINTAWLSVEPWKLLEALIQKLGEIRETDRIALELLRDGPRIGGNRSAIYIPKGQKEAEDRALLEDITIIWGPPGTGKTYTMSRIAMNAVRRGKSVLLVSHSNVSVDGVLMATANQLRDNGMKAIVESGKVLRYGYVRDETLRNDRNVSAFNFALNRNPLVKRKMDELLGKIENLKKTGSMRSVQRLSMEQELKRLRLQVREEEKSAVQEAQVVATTISKVTVDKLFEFRKFDIVMFDEVSMAYMPQLLFAASRAQEHFIAVGDFRQLSPIVQSDARTVLEKDVFSFLGISKGNTVNAHPWLVMLDEQRRMHPSISAFPSRYVYSGLLRDFKDVEKMRKKIVDARPMPGNGINLIDLTGTYCSAGKNNDNSRFNILSAIVSFATALEAEKAGKEKISVGIITPYAAQTRLIRAMMQDHRKKTDISCSTIHQFQGSERDVVLFDSVESFPALNAGWLMTRNDNNAVVRLINVAVTRARGKLITVANTSFWNHKYKDSPHIFVKLVQYLLGKGRVLSVRDKSLQEYLSTLYCGENIKQYKATERAVEALLKDLEGAENQILISLPAGEIDPKFEKEVFSKILERKHQDSRIRILSKSNDYKSLPPKWKNITWATENAVFPLILIDDKVIWYGLPVAERQFHDGDYTFGTVYQSFFRIVGEHTVEMIKSLTDLEFRVINGKRIAFIEKDAGEGIGHSEVTGLAAFIQEKEYCPNCRKPMVLARGRSGKYFIKCSICGKSALLKKELINWYIENRRVCCPKCRSEILAKVGQYGLYIRCEGGHNLKPDEI